MVRHVERMKSRRLPRQALYYEPKRNDLDNREKNGLNILIRTGDYIQILKREEEEEENE